MGGSRSAGISGSDGRVVAQRTRRNRVGLGVVQDASASLAMDQLAGARAAEFLEDVGPDAHATSCANFAANLGYRDAAVFLGDAFVMVQQIFRNHGNHAGAFGFLNRESF